MSAEISAGGSRKRRKKGNSAAPAEAPAPAAPPGSSWRDTLFFWRGELRYASPASDEPGVSRLRQVGVLVWSGTWVGSESMDVPSDAAFASSPNTFELRAPFNGGPGLDHMPDNVPDCSTFSGALKGSYLLEGAATKDKSHRFRVACLSTEADLEKEPVGAVACATGDTPFGRFVSLGTVTRRGDRDTPAACACDGACDGNCACALRPPAGPDERAIVLTLARRYVTKKDPRSSWKLPREVDLVRLLRSDPALVAEPWNALPIHYPVGVPPGPSDAKEGAEPLIEWRTTMLGMHPACGSTRRPSGPK